MEAFAKNVWGFIFVPLHLQWPSSADHIFLLRDPGTVIRHIFDDVFSGTAGGVEQVQTIQRDVVIHEEILLHSDFYEVRAANDFDVCI